MAEQPALASSVLPTKATSENLRTTASSAARAVSAERPAAGALGLRRFGHFVTNAELTAHFRILDVIAARRAMPTVEVLRSVGRVIRGREADRGFLAAFERQLWVFKAAPRCPCGRGPLKLKAELGLKRFSCVCGIRFTEVAWAP